MNLIANYLAELNQNRARRENTVDAMIAFLLFAASGFIAAHLFR